MTSGGLFYCASGNLQVPNQGDGRAAGREGRGTVCFNPRQAKACHVMRTSNTQQ